MQVADAAMESESSFADKEDPMELEEYEGNNNNGHDTVYTIDYHGVTTHPIPKHPKP